MMPALYTGLARLAAFGPCGAFDEPPEPRACPVEAARRQAFGVTDRAICTHFVYFGLRFIAAADACGAGTRVRICAHLGHVPFSIQSRVGREAVLTILRLTGGRLPRGRLYVSPKQEIFLEGVFRVDDVPSILTLIAAAAMFIAANKPYIQLFVDYSSALPKPIVTRSWLTGADVRRHAGNSEAACKPSDAGAANAVSTVRGAAPPSLGPR
jgi:hypothetical protein